MFRIHYSMPHRTRYIPCSRGCRHSLSRLTAAIAWRRVKAVPAALYMQAAYLNFAARRIIWQNHVHAPLSSPIEPYLNKSCCSRQSERKASQSLPVLDVTRRARAGRGPERL